MAAVFYERNSLLSTECQDLINICNWGAKCVLYYNCFCIFRYAWFNRCQRNIHAILFNVCEYRLPSGENNCIGNWNTCEARNDNLVTISNAKSAKNSKKTTPPSEKQENHLTT
ncbi:hypothetical protein DAMNIGENAA_33290 [Desulforhabdus amnigena]|uniref:Uncharacterized protein n=1 Tax=Desulforhabdus amnigena TaxID=40218 RepID=A0A9W6LAK3_9BACT|nr:hypothetical protein DAMNIGENAA_33290 [Desulforhabdus amnigena]